MSQSSSRSSRGYKRSFGGLIGALVAAFGVIAVVWGLTALQHTEQPNPVHTVDYGDALKAARREAPFAVLAPEPVPAGWRATSVDYTTKGGDVTWHLGFLTRDGEYVGLEEGNVSKHDLLEAKTRADQPGKPVRADGQRWGTLTSSDGDETAIVRHARGVTTLVTGTATLEQLTTFAARLR
ncbi:MAG: DUF4245 domain-containing protein [Nocardioidaceae bacterium]